ncbi:hypothetical protein [Pseudoalteromonas sp. TB64]|uniref:hypothetical protein n=1 Tax=Pseudoalteromonas sp. TB64 TaxID=1938600 RepID=UPI00041F9650|nr:hypothetical protein [Pseudoalteromonas sp. TB64]
MNKQSGQALVEVSVFIAFIIAPLMLLIPYFSNIIEAKHYAQMSSRYIAWERTAWLENRPGNWSGDNSSLAIKSTQLVNADIPWRILSGKNSVITSEQDSDIIWNKDKSAQFLKFNQSSQAEEEFLLAPYNSSEEDASLYNYFNNDMTNTSVPGTISSFISGALSVLEIGNFDVEKKGFYKANFTTQVTSHKLLEFINEDLEEEPENSDAEDENKRPHQFEFLISSTTYLLASGWNAGGQEHNEKRVRSLVPSNLLDFSILDTVRDGISEVPIAKKLNSDSLQFGLVKIEELPTSRKGNNVNGNEK